MNEPFEPEQSVEPKKEKWSRGRIAIGCGVALIIVVCACAILGAAGVGLLAYWGREPEGLSIQTEYPWTVQVDDEFIFILTLHNTGDKVISVGDIDLDEAFSGSILDGAVVERTEPTMGKDFSITGIKTFLYDRPLNPGETQEITFYLRAKEIGDFGGSIGVFVGDNAVRGDASISILP